MINLLILLSAFAFAETKTYVIPCEGTASGLCTPTVEGFVPEPNFGLAPMDGSSPAHQEDLKLVNGKPVVDAKLKSDRLKRESDAKTKEESDKAKQDTEDAAAKAACQSEKDPILVALCARFFK